MSEAERDFDYNEHLREFAAQQRQRLTPQQFIEMKRQFEELADGEREVVECRNCTGWKCMACRLRVVHDECVEDCPDCCDELAPFPLSLNAQRLRKKHSDGD